MPTILLDTDPGVDDALALLFLHLHPDVELAGITTVAGNGPIDVVTRNTQYLAHRFGITAPIARGAAESLDGHLHLPPPEIHGSDALGNVGAVDVDHPIDARPAHRFIIDTVRARPHQITLLAIGMLTNLAQALREDPGIAQLVRKVVIMGGSFSGHPGNASQVAEANIHADPHAAEIVLGATWPVQIIGLDVTERIVMTTAYLSDLRDRGGEPGAFAFDVTRGYADFHDGRGAGGIFAHDPSAAVCAIDETPFAFRRAQVRVVRDGFAAGLTIAHPQARTFPRSAWDALPTHDVATHVDAERVLALFAAPFLVR